MMSDFTKEELVEIKRVLKYMINGGTTPYSIRTMHLDRKVQTMIDTYCEHNEDVSYKIGTRDIVCGKRGIFIRESD